jgi:hypothetical protein
MTKRPRPESIAFQEFVPSEHVDNKRCIWCGQESRYNRAHIISRKLTVSSHASAILKYSICETCNSKCGEVEQWVLRHSPLGWIRFFYYFDSNRRSDSATFFSYFFAYNVGEWVVYNLDINRSRRTVPTQLLLSHDDTLTMYTQNPEVGQYEGLERIASSIRRGDYRTDIKHSLPADFHARVLIREGKVWVISRTKAEFDQLVRAFDSSRYDAKAGHLCQLQDSGRARQHFQWSRSNWLKFCVKIAYETLCLFEGQERCLAPEFETVRQYVLAGCSSHHRELVFGEHGPLDLRNTPSAVNVDLTSKQAFPRPFSALLTNTEPGMHVVAIYEIGGWICSSVSIAGFPPCFIAMGGPDVHLLDLYQLVYDEQEDQFHFLRLAYDQARPVIPVRVSGDPRAIARTYGLRAVG